MVILKTSPIVSKHTEMRNFFNALFFFKGIEYWVLRTGGKCVILQFSTGLSATPNQDFSHVLECLAVLNIRIVNCFFFQKSNTSLISDRPKDLLKHPVSYLGYLNPRLCFAHFIFT